MSLGHAAPTAKLLPLAVVFLAACAGGAADGDAATGGDGASRGDAVGADAAGPDRLTVFVFDQENRLVLRMADANTDGDAMDAGETTVFFTNEGPFGVFNSQGMVAVGAGELYLTDNKTIGSDANLDAGVIHLRDLDGDGDALDDGEATSFFAGVLPAPAESLTFPVALARGDDGALRLAEDYFNDAQPDAIYRLADENGDGDADDAGEVTRELSLGAPAAQIFDFALAGGVAYAIDTYDEADPNNASVDRITTDGRSEMVDAVGLYLATEGDERLILPGTEDVIEWDPRRDEVVIATIDDTLAPHVVGLRDVDGGGRFGVGEITVRWDAEVAALEPFAAVRDLVVLGDGTAVLTDAGRGNVWRLRDVDGDGRWDGTGAATLFYATSDAAGAGLPEAGNLFTTAVWAAGGVD